MPKNFIFTDDGKLMTETQKAKISKFKSEIIAEVEAHTSYKPTYKDEPFNGFGLELKDYGDHHLEVCVNDDATAIENIDLCFYDDYFGDIGYRIENREDMINLSNLMIVLSKYLNKKD